MSAEKSPPGSKEQPLDTGVMLENGSGDSPKDTENEDSVETSIDPENEVQGMRLILIHTAICLSTFLVGLVLHPTVSHTRRSNMLIYLHRILT